jgi:dUTP pyrophosphatase
MNKEKFINDGLTGIARHIESERANGNENHVTAIMCNKLLSYIYDTVVNPEIELKVLRSDDAKQFDLIHIKKDGDVGMDLPALFPYQEKFMDKAVRQAYHLKQIGNNKSDADIEREMREHITIWPGDRGIIPTGIKLEIPYGWWASIEARSSTSKYKLDVPKGVIDEGYRGELFAVLLNIGHDKVDIRHGDRLVQLLIHKRHTQNLKVVEVDELSPSERGESGFGSTGKSAIKQEG